MQTIKGLNDNVKNTFFQTVCVKLYKVEQKARRHLPRSQSESRSLIAT